MEKQPKYFKEGQTAWWLSSGKLIEGTLSVNEGNDIFPFVFNPNSIDEDISHILTITYDGRMFQKSGVVIFQKPFPIPQNVPITDDFQVGDRVKCKIRGLGNVKYIKTDVRYPVIVEFDNYTDGEYNYTLEGKFSITDYEPILTKI